MSQTTAASQEEREKVSSTELVFRAIVEAREYGRSATRRVIVEATNLPLTVVDDRVKLLKTLGRIQLAGGNVAGIYEPTEDRREDRAISSTILPTGRVKLEIGDTVLDLSMREARHIGATFGGFTMLFRGG